MTMNEIRKAGIEALTQALGPAGMLRFIQQFDLGHGDYTKDREKLLEHYTIEEIIEGIKQLEEEQEGKNAETKVKEKKIVSEHPINKPKKKRKSEQVKKVKAKKSPTKHAVKAK
jgi:hypothetical protein